MTAEPTPNILDFARPEKPLKTWQVNLLLKIVENIDKYDNFIISAPTATGKSVIIDVLSRWMVAALQYSSSVITPTKILQSQYQLDFPDIPLLKGQNAYTCIKYEDEFEVNQKSCEYEKTRSHTFCKDQDKNFVCPYMQDLFKCQAATTAIFNFHSYYYSSMYKDVLIVDEAHNAANFMFDFFDIYLWHCETNYDKSRKADVQHVSEVLKSSIEALQEYEEAAPSFLQSNIQKEISRQQIMLNLLPTIGSDVYIGKEVLEYHGSMRQFKDTKQECIRIKPNKVDNIGEQILWPAPVKKKFFFSGTINDLDREQLGLEAESTCIIDIDSPIPAENRLAVYYPVASMASKRRANSIPIIAKEIERILAHEDYANSKGVIHCIYSVAEALKDEIGYNKRLLFHDRRNKNKIYEDFLARDDNSVLVACGMEEGIDLAGDKAKFQIITQVRYPFLGDGSNKWRLNNMPSLYYWETIRKVIQMCGRACRYPDDYGITFILDSEFDRAYQYANNVRDFIPRYFRQCLKRMRKKNDQIPSA